MFPPGPLAGAPLSLADPSASGGGASWFAEAIWVDGGTAVAPGDQNGSMSAPYSTIQAAVLAAEAAMDALPLYSDPAVVAGTRNRQRQVIVVAGGIYDEDVVSARGNMFLEILALGPVVLGDAAEGDADAAFFDSTVPRSITWNNDQDVEDADCPASPAGSIRRPTLVLGTFPPTGESSSTHTAIASAWKISGDLIFTTGTITTAEVHLQNVLVAGDVDGTGDLGIRNCYVYRCKFDGPFDWPGANLQVVESSEFDGPTTIASYGRMVQCEIDGAFTYGSFAPALPPGGMIGCDLSGTFTGPAGSLHLDGTSNYYFKTNGAVLGGATTKTIIDDLVP